MNPALLRARLREIIQGPGSANAAPLQREPSAAAAGASVAHRSGRPLEDVLGGAWKEVGDGRSFVVTRRFDAEHRYGSQVVGAYADAVTGASSAAQVAAPAAAAPYLFFDLETTGLSGGAGTQAFIVGCGWFDADGSFVTEQHLLVDYAHERPMLSLVADAVDRSGAIVSFNGKSFDAPVIETRYLFHRLESPCAGRPHLDLLHPARRFWGGDAGASLTTLETQVLGAHRTGDVAGFEIPARYFQFLRSGDARPLEVVLSHNRLDLLSLAGLTARFLRLVDAGPAAARTAREALALGRVYERASMYEQAEASWVRTVELLAQTRGMAATAILVDALRGLALLLRRQRRYDDAAARWQQLLTVPYCPQSVVREAIEALAIHQEHRVRDLVEARALVLRSLELDGQVGWGDAARHRLARIERKLVSEPPSLLSCQPLPLSSDSPRSEPRTSS